MEEESGGGFQVDYSPHPIDRLIRELIQTNRPSTVEEARQIAARMAEAEFPTASHHLTRRIEEEQWAPGTLVSEYVTHLRTAAQHARSRILVYLRRGGHVAAAVGNRIDHVPTWAGGAGALPLLVVVYSADRGVILTGYQASSLARIAFPTSARWLGQ